MRSFRAGDVRAVSGLTAKQFRDWCEGGVAVPAAGGRGRGHHRRFTVMQVVGIVTGAEVRRGPLGCSLGFVRRVVAALGSMSEWELIAAFDRGRTHLGPAVPVALCEPRAGDPGGVDVRAVYERVAGMLERAARGRPAALRAGGNG